jgi:hypothetical protein
LNHSTISKSGETIVDTNQTIDGTPKHIPIASAPSDSIILTVNETFPPAGSGLLSPLKNNLEAVLKLFPKPEKRVNIPQRDERYLEKNKFNTVEIRRSYLIGDHTHAPLQSQLTSSQEVDQNQEINFAVRWKIDSDDDTVVRAEEKEVPEVPVITKKSIDHFLNEQEELTKKNCREYSIC